LIHKIQTYCSFDFLDNFLDELYLSSDGYDRKVRKIQDRLYDLLIEKSSLTMDIRPQGNPLMEKFFDDWNLSGEKLYEDQELFNQLINDENCLDKIDPCSIHLHEGNQYFDLRKIFLARKDDWKRKLQSVNQNAIEYSISKINNSGDFVGWKELGKKVREFPMNSLVICNNYVLEKKEAYENNIFSIIRELLPQHINCDFHLTIIAGIIDKDNKNKRKARYDKLKNYIEELNKSRDYPICFNLFFLDTKKVHSRMMISNYWRVTSDHNFDFYTENDEQKYTSKLMFLPLNCPMDGNQHNTLRRELAAEINSAENSKDHFGWEGRNRLLIQK